MLGRRVKVSTTERVEQYRQNHVDTEKIRSRSRQTGLVGRVAGRGLFSVGKSISLLFSYFLFKILRSLAMSTRIKPFIPHYGAIHFLLRLAPVIASQPHINHNHSFTRDVVDGSRRVVMCRFPQAVSVGKRRESLCLSLHTLSLPKRLILKVDDYAVQL